MRRVDDAFLDLIFNEARTHTSWQDKPVPEALLREIYDLSKMGPTSANCCPMRSVFVISNAAKEKLKPALAEGNVDKTMAAPVCAIMAHDIEFYEHLPRLFPQADARSWFAGDDALIEATAFRNGTLQAGYFILAARALGLDCGPMSGFDNAQADAVFFAGTSWRSNFLINLGYGDKDALHSRGPRLSFDDACRVE